MGLIGNSFLIKFSFAQDLITWSSSYTGIFWLYTDLHQPVVVLETWVMCWYGIMNSDDSAFDCRVAVKVAMLFPSFESVLIRNWTKAARWWVKQVWTLWCPMTWPRTLQNKELCHHSSSTLCWLCAWDKGGVGEGSLSDGVAIDWSLLQCTHSFPVLLPVWWRDTQCHSVNDCSLAHIMVNIIGVSHLFVFVLRLSPGIKCQVELAQWHGVGYNLLQQRFLIPGPVWEHDEPYVLQKPFNQASQSSHSQRIHVGTSISSVKAIWKIQVATYSAAWFKPNILKVFTAMMLYGAYLSYKEFNNGKFGVNTPFWWYNAKSSIGDNYTEKGLAAGFLIKYEDSSMGTLSWITLLSHAI